MATLMPEGKQSFRDDDGLPLVGGKVWTYNAGTSSPRPTYQDAAGTVPNTNPIILDARGEATVFWSGAYKIVLMDPNDVVVWTVDNVQSANTYTDDLRALLASSAGASNVGVADGVAGARFTDVQGAINDLLDGVTGIAVDVSAFPYLAKCDGLTDDTAAVNAAVLYLAQRGGGRLMWPTGKTCKLLGKVWVVSNVQYDLNGSKLIGGGVATGVMFETAYLNAGTLVTNVGTAYQSHVIKNAKIFGGRVEEVGQMCNFQNFNMGCKVHDLELFNARQLGVFDACFYAHFDTVMHSGGTVDTLPSFHFKSSNNAIELNKVITTCAWDYHFDGGSTAVTMIGCSQEGGVKGIKITGDMLGLTIVGNYAEAIPGTWLDLTDASNMAYDISSSYFNYVDVVVDDDLDNFTRFGRWAESNQIVNVGQKTDPLDPLGFVYRGRMQLRNRLNLVEFELDNNLSGSMDIPAHWIVGPNTSVSFTSTLQLISTTEFRKKALVPGGLIPLRFSGDTGTALDGYVPFCTVTMGTTTHIDTKIKWQPLSLFAKFALRANDGSGLHDLYGDIYGALFKRHDTAPMVMAISDNGGFLRISLTQIAPPFASVTGTVQICS